MTEHTTPTEFPSALSFAPEATVRVPQKGEGVPREEREGTFVPAFCAALATIVPVATTAALAEEREFFDAALTRQWQILAEVAIELAGAEASLPLLEASPDARVRGIAPEVVRRGLLDDPVEAVAHLRRQSALPGTAIQELSQVALKAMCVRHGLETVLPLVDYWITDPVPEIRRCLVEALRPRGVWTGHLMELRRDPTRLRPLLEPVLDDPSLYVRKAVANCLNDVSKDHPERLVAWAEAWQGGGGTERQWILTRGLRALVRDGHPEALRLLGVSAPEQLEARWTSALPKAVVINQELVVQVEATNRSTSPAQVLVQAALAGPGRGSKPRVRRYRIGAGTAPAGGTVAVAGSIHFVDFNSQPKLPGTYELALTVNGVPLGTRSFRYGL